MEIPKSLGKYSIFGTLGQGGYGKVFVARDSKSLESVAIKFSGCVEFLRKEFKILQAVYGLEGFVKAFEFSTINQTAYMVMEMLGKSLQYSKGDLLLPLKTIAAVAIQLLSRLETLHSKGILHRDMKPQQFLLSNEGKTISLIDFGLASYFLVKNHQKPFKTKCVFKGSSSFASINCHMGFRQSRRDDLESLIYSLLYLAKGELPWICDSRLEGAKRWNFVLNLKVKTDKVMLFKDLPPEFEMFFSYVRKLKYEQIPNYSYLKSLMKKFLGNEILFMNFEWILNPFFNLSNKSFVEIKNKTCFVILQRGSWKMKVKRRNGCLNVSGNEKNQRSSSFLKLLATQDDLNSSCKISKRRNRVSNISESLNNGLPSTTPIFQKTYQGTLLNIPDFSMKSANFSISDSLPEFFFEKEPKENPPEKEEECLTDRGDFPELKDKSKVLTKKLNLEKSLKKSQMEACIMF